MKTNAELEALSNDPEPRIAASACVGLARRYGVGLFGTEPNQLTALDWATKAAGLGSPNGYYQYAQIAGSASLSFDDPENKAYFASIVIQACDLTTLESFHRPAISCLVGFTSFHTSWYLKDIGDESAAQLYQTAARSYYFQALMQSLTNPKRYARSLFYADEALHHLDRNLPPPKPDGASAPIGAYPFWALKPKNAVHSMC